MKISAIKKYTPIIFLFLLLIASRVHAYIGPGAGFALLSSLWALMLSFLAAAIALLTLPLRILRLLFRGSPYKRAKIKRAVILGLDGLDPQLCDHFLQQRLMPNLAKLRDTGTLTELATTFPALSPVAWSTFATGVNPGRNNIYDFLARNPQTYLPELSSTRISAPKRKLKLGKYTFPLGTSRIRFLRKSKSFWRILGERGIFSHVIRVPITYPPESFNGLLLSAMCAPDLLGTQGSFSFYSSAPSSNNPSSGGVRLALEHRNGLFIGRLPGPDHPFRFSADALQLEFTLSPDQDGQNAALKICGNTVMLQIGEFSEWLPVTFRAGLVKIRGICQFYLKKLAPTVELYASPINIDPMHPALPISHPFSFAVYLAKLLGRFSTLGLAEDTWALNEEVLDERGFLKQAYRLFDEREKQFFHALAQTRQGLCTGVFDGSDRIQHMFYRCIVDDHPANKQSPSDVKNAISDIYRKCDEIIGRTIAQLTDDTLLIVLSDHGFKSFERGVNLNAWLHQEGYLALKNEEPADYLQNVDWSRTRAFALGLAGIYLNVKGRERSGIVEKEETAALKQEISVKLVGVIDPERNRAAIRSIYDARQIYQGAYVDKAPDLIIGFHAGYRVSWDSAVGKVRSRVFEDNEKKWSGDHAVDPAIVPGILAGNFKLLSVKPSIADIAPTILAQFGVPVPRYIDGKVLEIKLAKLNGEKDGEFKP